MYPLKVTLHLYHYFHSKSLSSLIPIQMKELYVRSLQWSKWLEIAQARSLSKWKWLCHRPQPRRYKSWASSKDTSHEFVPQRPAELGKKNCQYKTGMYLLACVHSNFDKTKFKMFEPFKYSWKFYLNKFTFVMISFWNITFPNENPLQRKAIENKSERKVNKKGWVTLYLYL